MNYFLALLPELNSEFYRQLDQLFSLGVFFDIRLPLHVTIYYFGALSQDNISEISAWMDSASAITPAFNAETAGIKYFPRPTPKSDQINVFYLDVKSPHFYNLNSNLLKEFPSLSRESWSYTPHLSLIFPHQLSPSPELTDKINQIFLNTKNLTFNRLALFASNQGAYTLIKQTPLHGK